MELEVEALAHGGMGLARLEGRAVFVPRAAPGDCIRARLESDKDNYARAELLDVLAPGPGRREPPCPYYSACGGCQLQHLDAETQAHWKRAIFGETLRRVGGIAPPEDLPSLPPRGAPLGYRRWVRFQLRGGELGFFAARSHHLVPVERCLLAVEPINRLIPPLRAFLRAHPELAAGGALEVAWRGEGEGCLLHVIADSSRGRARRRGAMKLPRRSLSLWAEFGRAQGVAVAAEGKLLSGSPEEARSVLSLPLDDRAEPLRLGASPGRFLQPNARENGALVGAVLELARPRPGDQPVDLFCGVGNLSLPLAARAGSVLGVELDPLTVRDARRNARECAISGCQFLCGEAGAVLRERVVGKFSPRLIVLDPPRNGAPSALEPIAGAGPERVVYVSCDPATLARDVRTLAGRGYRLAASRLVPMFPQNHHIESVNLLLRGVES
ncbi:MAG: class I SAM-dependent RNA methyltransferase [Nitrospinota bacterium]